MQIKTIKLNTPNITQECSRIPGDGLWTISSRFLQIRVEVLALLVEYKCEQIIPSIYQFKHKYIKQVMNMNNNSMQDINTSER